MNIFEEIRKLNFTFGQYVVVGSGPMVARGIKEARDIDIVVIPELFEKCKREGWEQTLWTYPEKLGQIYLRKGFVELYLDVNCSDFNPTTQELIKRAEIIDSIPFITLEDMLKFKKSYNKEKHQQDIEATEKYLNGN